MILRFLLFFIFVNSLYADTIEEAGDIGQVLIPAIAWGVTIYQNDNNGTKELYKSFGATMATTYLLKYTVKKKRPNGGGHSFPSGHTASAFSGASFIHAKYGLKYGLLAYAGATFVGYSRLHANAHWREDVYAGAIIGIINSFIWTTRKKELTISPDITKNSVKLQAKYIW
jgi:membrane-associated phospholipid phosphatase